MIPVLAKIEIITAYKTTKPFSVKRHLFFCEDDIDLNSGAGNENFGKISKWMMLKDIVIKVDY